MNLVDIVMTTYNGEKYISEQIESILASTHEEFRLFIYDDGSKDKTLEILKAYEKNNSDKIKVFQNEVNLGVTTNFLQALCKTTADYIMLCDQDDVWKPNKVEITLLEMKRVEQNTKKNIPIAVFTDTIVVDQQLEMLQPSFFKVSHLDPYKTDLPHLMMENKLIGCTVMINSTLRSFLNDKPLPQKAKFHDWWIALIAASFGKISFLNVSTLLYRQHGNNVVGNTSFLAYVKNRIVSLQDQKKSLMQLQFQAEEFYFFYKDVLNEKNRIIIYSFAHMQYDNFIRRRYKVIHYKFYKTGLVRNIGLMFIL